MKEIIEDYGEAIVYMIVGVGFASGLWYFISYLGTF